jgi:uncharacterized surface protein with fasciclin (FAS1) repeats
LSHFLLPPPPIHRIISAFPTTFSTLELGLTKTGLLEALNTTGTAGKTFFAPTNFAFLKLGPRINAFLFSKFGEKYLKALLEYHVSPNTTLYSTTIYAANSTLGQSLFSEIEEHKPKCHDKKDGIFNRIKSYVSSPKKKGAFAHVHVDLPTLLEGKSIAVDIFRTGPFVRLKLNAVIPVKSTDGIAADGVLHIIDSVLIPPRTPKSTKEKISDNASQDEELSLEDLMKRLEPFVPAEDRVENGGLKLQSPEKFEF